MPASRWLGEVVGRFSGQQGQYPPYILVIHHAYDDVQLAVSLLFQLFCNVGDASYIVPGVTNQGGRFVQFLPASHQARQFRYMGKAATHRLSVQPVAGFFQQREGGKYSPGIFLLVEPFQFVFYSGISSRSFSSAK